MQPLTHTDQRTTSPAPGFLCCWQACSGFHIFKQLTENQKKKISWNLKTIYTSKFHVHQYSLIWTQACPSVCTWSGAVCSRGRVEYLLHRWPSLNSLVSYRKFVDPFFIILPLASAQELAELGIVHLFCSTLYSARNNHLTFIILPGNYLAKFLEFIEYIFYLPNCHWQQFCHFMPQVSIFPTSSIHFLFAFLDYIIGIFFSSNRSQNQCHIFVVFMETANF